MSVKLKKTGIRLAIFVLIATFVLWLIPAGLVYGEGEDTTLPSIEELQQVVTDATATLAAAQAAAADAAIALAEAEQALTGAQTALSSAAEGDDLTILQQAVDDASAALADAQSSSASADAAIADAQAALDAAQAALDAAENEGIGEVEDPIEDPIIDPIEDPLLDTLADPLLDPELSMMAAEVSEARCITISIHKYAEWNGQPGQQFPDEPNLSAKFKLEWSVLGFIWFNGGEKWTDSVSGDASFTAIAGLLYRIKEIDRDPGFIYTDTLPKYIPDCNGDRIWWDKCYEVSNPVEPMRCYITIAKTVDGEIPVEGSFDFTVTESGTDGLEDLGIPIDLIPESFTLDVNNAYGATFAVECGVTYTITEEGPPSGFTFDSINSDIPDPTINGQSITFTADCCQIRNVSSIEQPIEVIELYGTITFNNLKTIPGSNLLRLNKTSSATGLPVAGAVYSLYLGTTLIYDLIPTGVDGSTLVSLPNLNTVYTVKEKTAPAGYDLDPDSYTVTSGSAPILITLNVTDDPSTGGGGTVTVAAITESVQVLAFTGVDPIIPISGGSIIIAGLGMLLATLRKRVKAKVQ